jgi:hypothetical protein
VIFIVVVADPVIGSSKVRSIHSSIDHRLHRQTNAATTTEIYQTTVDYTYTHTVPTIQASIHPGTIDCDKLYRHGARIARPHKGDPIPLDHHI